MGNNVLVYGANGSLGKAIVKQFYIKDFNVIYSGRSITKLKLAKSSLDVPGVIKAFSITEDIDPDIFKDIDVVINATGKDVRKPLIAQELDEIKSQLDINLLGAINMTKSAVKEFQKKGSGTILHLGGFGDGTWPSPYYTADVATRAGLYSFIESMNIELMDTNINVQYFCPLPAKTLGEEPYHDLWKSMGVPIVEKEEVAKSVFKAVIKGSKREIMGSKASHFIYKLRHLFPGFINLVMAKPMGIKTMKYIDSMEEK